MAINIMDMTNQNGNTNKSALMIVEFWKVGETG